jgi:hypothetical protein
MASLRQKLAITAMALCLGCCASLTPQPPQPQKDYTSLSLRLKKDMTEGDVTETLGAPDKNDQITCTEHNGNPWQCKSWIYEGGRPKNNLRLIFYQGEDKTWKVVSWQVY